MPTPYTRAHARTFPSIMPSSPVSRHLALMSGSAGQLEPSHKNCRSKFLAFAMRSTLFLYTIFCVVFLTRRVFFEYIATLEKLAFLSVKSKCRSLLSLFNVCKVMSVRVDVCYLVSYSVNIVKII